MSSIPVIVVGYTTETSSRIFVCVADAGEEGPRRAHVWWRAAGRSGTVDLDLRAADPYLVGVAELVDLPACARVEYTVQHALEPAAPSADAVWHCFRLLRDPSEPLKIALVSCIGSDEVPVNARYKLWGELRDRIRKGDVDLVIHAGDQIYGDGIREKHADADEQTLRHHYRRQYACTWSNDAVREVHRSCPSIMMWDDHEFFDGYGSRSDHGSDVSGRFYGAALAAFETFQISHGPPSLERASSFATAFTHGSTGFLIVDGRRNRTPTTVLGEPQLAAISRWLDEHAERLEHLFVVAAIPFAHASLGVFLARLNEPLDAPAGHWWANLVRGLKDRWVAPDHRDECATVLRLLFDAKKRCPSLRISILSGDVHVGTSGAVVSYTHGAVIPQITSSAIGSFVPSGLYAHYMRIGTHLARWFEGRLGDGIYGRLGLVCGVEKPALMRRNFAIVTLDGAGDGPRGVSYRYFAERDPRSPEIDELPQPDPIYER